MCYTHVMLYLSNVVLVVLEPCNVVLVVLYLCSVIFVVLEPLTCLMAVRNPCGLKKPVIQNVSGRPSKHHELN